MNQQIRMATFAFIHPPSSAIVDCLRPPVVPLLVIAETSPGAAVDRVVVTELFIVFPIVPGRLRDRVPERVARQ